MGIDGHTKKDARAVVDSVPHRQRRSLLYLHALVMEPTLSEWFPAWLVWRRARFRSATEDERAFRRWIEPSVGHVPVASIARSHLRGWVAYIDGCVAAGELHWSTATHYWGLLRSMMREASASKVDALRVRDDNPADGVLAPDRGPVREGTFLYPREFLQLMLCRDIPLARRRGYVVAVYLYARAGELEALACEDVDLLHGIIRIYESIARDGVVGPTKTHAQRLFMAEATLIPLLRVLVFEAGGTGRLLYDWCRMTFARTLREDLRRAGCRRDELYASSATRRPITGHDLRATGITWRAMRGDPLVDIQEAVGHKSIATTERYVRRGRAFARAFGGTVFPPLLMLLDDRVLVGYRARWGACYKCGRPAIGKRCYRCRAQHRKSERRRRAKARRRGRCLLCTASAYVDERSGKRRRYCRTHLDYYLHRWRAYKAKKHEAMAMLAPAARRPLALPAPAPRRCLPPAAVA